MARGKYLALSIEARCALAAMDKLKAASRLILMRHSLGCKHIVIRLMLFLLACLTVSAKGDGFLDSSIDYKFEPNSDTVVYVAGLKDSSITHLTIPSSVVYEYSDLNDCDDEGKPKIKHRSCRVMNVGELAFIERSNLLSVEVATSITNIGGYAFSQCRSLRSVVLPNVISINTRAFESCNSLESITMPKVKNIESYAFTWCRSLVNLDVQSVTNIGQEAFSYCSGLEYIEIPESVKIIGSSTFSSCTSLRSAIMNGVTNVGYRAFSSCSLMENVSMRSVESISWYAFNNCSALANINAPNIVEIGQKAFNGCTSLKYFEVPETVTVIDSGAFNGCRQLESIVFKGVPPGYSAYYVSGNIIDGDNCIGHYSSSYDWEASISKTGYWRGLKMEKLSEVKVSITFVKSDELETGCDKAYWICYSSNGGTAFPPVKSGEAFSIPMGTYTIHLYSGESEFSDPDPIAITIDGTEDRIEREVVLHRKKVKFNCRFYNTPQKDYGILPSCLGLDSYCIWSLDGNEWHTSGQSVEVPTGTYNIELKIDERIHLMAYADILSTPITLDGSATEHTEYVNVLGSNGAKVSFKFSAQASATTVSNFDESLVYITLRNSQGDSMIVPAGEYCLPKGDYVASFSYRQSNSEEKLWRVPEDVAFSINGRNREFSLLFVDIESAPIDWTTAVWFDANGGESEATVLRYVLPMSYDYTFGSVPEAHQDGYIFLGWFSSKNGGRQYTKDSFVPRYNDSGIEYVDVDNERRIHLYAHWKKTNMTSSWLSRFSTINAASNGDVEFAGALTAANGKMTVSDCFDVGVNPENPNDDFKITAFWMERNVPRFEFNHTTDGSGNSFLQYVQPLGKANLTDCWHHVPEGGDPSFRFFTVEVVPPAGESIVKESGRVQLWENGPYWAECNIGAESPEDYGYYFWWGDIVGYKREGDSWVASDGSSSNYSFGSNNTPTYNKRTALQSEGWIISQDETYILAPEHDAAQVHWGGDWRMPTYQELCDLFLNKCDWTWTTLNGVNGYIVRGRGDYASASIFLPCAGYGYGTSLNDSGSGGYFWSSVLDSDIYYTSSCRHFNSVGRISNYDNSRRYNGLTIRPVQGFAK